MFAALTRRLSRFSSVREAPTVLGERSGTGILSRLDTGTNESNRLSGPHQPEELGRNLAFMLWDVVFFSAMVGLGEQYISAFAIKLGFSDTVAGWITTLPLLSGAALQLITPWAVARLGSHRRWVIGCVTVQGLSFIPLVLAAIFGGLPQWALFVIAGLYWGAGLAAGPAWNAWVTGIVPVEIRSSFLAKRTRVGQFSLLAAVLLAGWALQAGKAADRELLFYTLLFAAAGICRLISAACLFGKTESASIRPVRAVLNSAGSQPIAWYADGAGMLLAYLWLMYATAQISGPFFVPYLLKDMGCSYFTFMTVLGVSILCKAMIMPFAGRFAQKYGARRLLFISGATIVPLSACWMISREIPFILLLQGLAGVCWGAFELGIVLIFIETIPVARRTKVLTIYNFGYAVASVLGSLAGGWLLWRMGNTTNAYYWVFGVSSIGRMTTLAFIGRLPERIKETHHLTSDELAAEAADTSPAELTRDLELLKVHD